MDPTVTASSVPSQHLDYLDGLRGLAALQVVLGHAAAQIPWDSAAPNQFLRAALWPISFGREAVALFIVLSGFCLMLPVLRRQGVLQGGAWLFFKRRARRILPPYYCALALSVLLVWTLIGEKTGTHWDVCLPVDAKAIWTHLLLLQDLFHDTSARINHVMWSISVEWRIYFLFPLLVLMWRKVGSLWATGLGVVASYLLVRWFHFNGLNTGAFGMCLQFVGLFALGMFGAGLAYSTNPRLLQLRQAVPWFVFTAALLVAAILSREPRVFGGRALPWYLRDYLIGLFGTCLIVMAASQPSDLLHRVLAWRPIVFLGTIGYSLYLMHAPFQQVLVQYVVAPLGLPPATSFLVLAVLGTPLVIGFSYGFYLLCERPFLNVERGPSILGKSATVPSAAKVRLGRFDGYEP